MTKSDLLRLLDDAEVQQKIFNIAAGKDTPIFDNTKKISEQEKISQLQSDLQKARAEIYQLRHELALADNRVKNAQSKQLDAENSAREHKLRADQLNQTYQEKFDRLRKDKERVERRESQLESSIAQLKEKLAERFGRGWNLFQEYRYLTGHARDILDASVFQRQDNFTAFICAAAQPNSLEIIWDTVKECVFIDQPRDADTIWKIFLYAVELVNSAKSRDIFEILPVDIGDRFDSDFHAEGPNSRAQGIVSKIFIAGYKNSYSGKILRKSIVQVS